MIRLRRLLERGRRHPVLGPIVLVLLVLVLAMVCFHAAHEGWDGAAEAGAVCFVIVAILGAVVCDRLRSSAPLLVLTRWFGRGPPLVGRAPAIGSFQPAPRELVLPLRR